MAKGHSVFCFGYLLLNLGGNAGGDTVRGYLVNQSVLSGLFSLLELLLGLLDLRRCGLGQGTNGEGDLVLVVIDSSDLGIDHVTDGQHILGLADAAVGNLGDMDQAVHTGRRA